MPGCFAHVRILAQLVYAGGVNSEPFQVDPGSMNSKAFTIVGELLNIAISSLIISGIGTIEGKEKFPATSPSMIKAKFGFSSVNPLN
jgi:hypothetical protein